MKTEHKKKTCKKDEKERQFPSDFEQICQSAMDSTI